MTDSLLPQNRGRWRRITRQFLITTAVILAIVYIPFVPYSPRCSDRGQPSSVGSVVLAENFKRALTESFDFWDVSYLPLPRIVLLRFWTLFDDPDDLVLNSSNKSVLHFVDKTYGASLETIPPHVLRMVEKARNQNGFIDLNCTLVRAVAIDGW
jgi:hypothetical protein